jgi:hypothetical protein
MSTATSASAFRLGAEVIKLHMQGKHNQKSHGGGRGGGMEAGAMTAEPRRRNSERWWQAAAGVGVAAGALGVAAYAARKARTPGGAVRTGGVKAPGRSSAPGRPSAGSGDLSPKATDAIRRVEVELRGLDHERGLIFDADGKVLDRTGKGHAHGLYFTPEQQALMRDQVMTHNHPSGDVPFSGTDVLAFSDMNVREGRVVGKTKTFRLLRPEGGWPPVKELDGVLEKAKADAMDSYIDQAQSNQDLKALQDMQRFLDKQGKGGLDAAYDDTDRKILAWLNTESFKRMLSHYRWDYRVENFDR